MNIGFYSGEIYRGVETYVHSLSNELIKLGVDVTVYQNGPTHKDAKYKTISIDLKIDWNKKSSIIPMMNYWSLLIRRFTKKVLNNIGKDVDIVIPTNGQWQSILCSIWAKFNHKKIIISGQSGPGLDDRINLWTFPNNFIALTNSQQKWAKSANFFVKSSKIPNGVDLNKFTLKAKSLKIDLPRPIILNVAALQDWKRQELAIKGVAELNEGSLLLVGKGSEENHLQDLGNKLLPNRFKIMNFPHDEMPAVYEACDLFTFPTVPWESFGIVMVEAMASGLPIVATDDPIRREIVGNAGLFVDPKDTEKYARILTKALEIKWGNAPRKQAEKFSWDDIAKKYKKLFNDLLK